ncbi:hypothetical protein KFE25_012057 [Diacronema lutheri]|uniref:Uncharacterized protein n=1 Tax=Diacronema lutheri TaxID=2081491 RepID=A0A8J5XEE3_DIALT|nr:hypothetical protein KFE25_012057 [Diacronema lutheri]
MHSDAVAWPLPALHAAVVTLRDAEPAARALHSHGFRLRHLGDDVFLAWGRAPLDADALSLARAPPCTPIAAPSAALLELLARDCVDECLARLGLFRLGEDLYLLHEQLCVAQQPRCDDGARQGADHRAERRLKPTCAVRAEIAITAGADGVSAAALTQLATVTFTPCTVRFRQQLASSPLVMRTLLPHMRRTLDAEGLVDLRGYCDDYEAAGERAVALLAPSLARVTVLCLATDRARLDAHVASRLPLARGGGCGGEDGGALYALRPDFDLRVPADSGPKGERRRAPPAWRAPLGELPLWALVQANDSVRRTAFADDEFGLALLGGADDAHALAPPLSVDPVALAAALLDGPRPASGVAPPRSASIQCVLVVNAVHLLDAVGPVASALDAEGADGGEAAPNRAPRVGVREACVALHVALGGADVSRAAATQQPDGIAQLLRPFATRPVMSHPPPARAACRHSGPAEAEGSTAMEGHPAGARASQPPCEVDDQDWAIAEGAARALADEPDEPRQPRAPTRFRTAAQLLGANAGARHADLAARDVLQPDGSLADAGLRAIDAAWSVCDRDGDGLLGRADLDFFQALTGGEPLDDDDFAYFCASFESMDGRAGESTRRGLTRAGFRAYFSHAFAEDPNAALADLKALVVHRDAQ